MKLYHGSNTVVEKPEIRENLRALDFGAGFYVTSNKKQAEKWARAVTKRRQTGNATVNIYSIMPEELEKLSILRFNTANGEWLDFVVSNRKGMSVTNNYDIVIGPVANDSTLIVIDDYIDGVYTKAQAVERLLPQNLTDQYAFLTDNALKLLHFEGEDTL